MRNDILCGDCLEILPTLPTAKMIFADPPDNLGVDYNGFKDQWCKRTSYIKWLRSVIKASIYHSDIFWLSYWQGYDLEIKRHLPMRTSWYLRQFIWRFTFGQHRQTDCGNGYRPILRFASMHAKRYPDAIRVPSARQLKYNDKRADPRGRVPDDVWKFPRVCGTFHERRKWHPNQHPEALIERIVKFSCVPGDLVIDMFGGTGTVRRVCKKLGIDCITIEISPYYCEMMKKEADP